MQLTTDTIGHIIEYLRTNWKDPKCPVCQNREWNVADRVFELREFNEGGLVVGGGSQVYPVLMVTCSSCGNTLLLNALIQKTLKQPALKQMGDTADGKQR